MIFKEYNYNSVNSTNNVAIKKIKQGINSGIILTKEQKLGRGRYGRKWISLKGNLFTTLFFKIDNNINLKKLTKFNCKLIKKTIENIIKKKVKIKPPNDLLINNKKVCGILQEVIIQENKKFIIIGVGINIVASPKITHYKTTYLNEKLKIKITYLDMYKLLKKHFEENLISIKKCI